MATTEPADRRVRADVYRIARTYLEVERGLRPTEHLHRFLSPAEYRRHSKRPRHPSLRTGEPVRPTDIGRIRLDRNLPGQITATVPTRETGDRWGALVLHFARNHTGRWSIDQLERLTRPSVVRDATRQPPAHADLDERIRLVEEERRIVDAAHRATRTRLAELRQVPAAGTAEGKDAIRQLRQQQRTWKRRRVELDLELDQLHVTRDLRRALVGTDLPRDRHPTQLDDTQLEQLLGPAPEDSWRRGLWDGLADEIHSYRHRWNISDQHSVLGPPSADPSHAHDRDQLAFTLRASARALGTRRLDEIGREHAPCRSNQHDQVRGVSAER